MPESRQSDLTPQSNNFPITDRIYSLIEMRRNRDPVDILQMFEAFPEPVRQSLLKGMQHLQFTDGCTGGCPWCSFDVKRKITSGFDFESFTQFATKYAKYLPERVALYWASDPFDISGNRQDGTSYDYDDVVSALIPHLRREQKIYTSTTVPKGTEAIVVKLLQHLQDVSKRDITLYNDTSLHTVRFSITDSNKETVYSIKRQLYTLGLDAKYIEGQFRVAKEVNEETIKKLGKFIRHPERQVISRDSMTVACYDGVLTTPDGLYSIYMDMATKNNPYGYGLKKLDPTDRVQEIPTYRDALNYLSESVAEKILNGSEDVVMPAVEIDRKDTHSGESLETVVLPSLRRDALTFFYALTALGLLPESVSPQAQNSLRYMKTELEKRYAIATSQFSSEIDEEAKFVIKPLWKALSEKLNAFLSSFDS
ncbi:MAG TPA: hypothetical protein VMR81_07900 [Patescibacteria group bacterium]|nr:hypothetical protein [Patescibacteria group bacterium]